MKIRFFKFISIDKISQICWPNRNQHWFSDSYKLDLVTLKSYRESGHGFLKSQPQDVCLKWKIIQNLIQPYSHTPLDIYFFIISSIFFSWSNMICYQISLHCWVMTHDSIELPWDTETLIDSVVAPTPPARGLNP